MGVRVKCPQRPFTLPSPAGGEGSKTAWVGAKAMPQELARRYCPRCRREVDAIRSTSGAEWFWYLTLGIWNLLFDRPEPWRCRDCGAEIPPTRREAFWRRVWLATVIVVVLAVILFAVIEG